MSLLGDNWGALGGQKAIMRLISFNHYWRNILTLKMLFESTETSMYKTFCLINEIKRYITWLSGKAKSYCLIQFSSIAQSCLTLCDPMQFSSVSQSCLTLCDPMDCSTSSFPVHHQLPRVYSNSCPLSRWCHPTISSSVVPFSSCLQSFPASGSFQMSQLFEVAKVLELSH